MEADSLNVQMETFMDRLDRVGRSAPENLTRDINATLSDWQDFYWANLEQWPVNDLALWRQKVPEIDAALTKLERSAGTEIVPVTSAPKGPVTELSPLRIVGTWPTWMKVAAGGFFSVLLYNVAKKTKLL